MTAAHGKLRPEPVNAWAALSSIVCATDSSERGAEAVRQAATLAGAGVAIEIVTTAPEYAPGAPHPRAEQIGALVRASRIATALGTHPEVHILEAPTPAQALLQRCEGSGLLVGPADEPLFAVMAGARVPVLLARRPPRGTAFPETILVAVDGTAAARSGVEVAARLAARHDAHVALVASPERDAAHERALLGDMALLTGATGVAPLVLDEYGSPIQAIVAAAASIEASLIVLGSRPGTPPDSVSSAVARRASCSVLLMRPGTPGQDGAPSVP